MLLTIGGADVTQYLARGSCHISRQVAQRSTCSFMLHVLDASGYTPEQDDAVLITDGGVSFFGGLIDQVDVVLQDSTAAAFQFSVTCTDWAAVCDRRIVIQEYIPAPVLFVGDIVDDLVSSFLSGEGITTSNVEHDSTVTDNLVYHGKSVREVLDNLSQITGDQWWIDFDKDLHFQPLAAADLFSGYEIATDNGFYRPGLVVSRPRNNYRNVQYVRSDQIVHAIAHQKTFTATAGQTAFPLSFPISSLLDIHVNDVLVTVKELGFGAVPGSDWYYLIGVAMIVAPDGLLVDGDSVRIRWNAFTDNAVKVEDAAQISARAAATGGSGRFEELEEVKGADAAAATTIAQGLLRKYSGSGYSLTVTFANDYPPPDPGMLLRVDLPEFAVSGDLLVQSVQSQSLDDEDLGHGIVFRSTVQLVSTEEQQTSAVQWFANLVERTEQGDPTPTSDARTLPEAAAGDPGLGGWFQERPIGAMNGSRTLFYLTYAPRWPQYCILELNGVVQDPYADYVVSGNTITYAVPPKSTDKHVIWYFRGAAGLLPEGAITSAELSIWAEYAAVTGSDTGAAAMGWSLDGGANWSNGPLFLGSSVTFPATPFSEQLVTCSIPGLTSLTGFEILAFCLGSLFADGVRMEFRIYDISLAVTYANGITDVVRPSVNAVDSSAGTGNVVDPTKCYDTDAATPVTYGYVYRTHFSGLSGSASVTLSDWA